ncbi:MAG: polyamine aminopropyltransferase [Rhodospirillaceae bacterium]
MTGGTESWFSEKLHPAFQQRFTVGEVLHRSHTGLQDLLVFDNPFFGRILALDGVVQTTERDEFCYHEMIAHVPILAHGAVRDVLIVGGGDGGTLRDVLRHGSVERATMVEIDGKVVDLCRQYLPGLSAGAFDDPRTELVIGDGLKYVRETDRRFDLIVVDSTDPIGPATPLFSDEFYADCRDLLTDDGIVVCQSGVGFVQPEEAAGTLARMQRLFADPALYLAQVPTYAFGFMTLGWGAKSARARATDAATIRARFDAAGIETRYYTPEIHAACFALPAYMRS